MDKIIKSDKERGERLVERLDRHPEFRRKVEELLDIADNKSGDANTADDAEDLIWEGVGKGSGLIC